MKLPWYFIDMNSRWVVLVSIAACGFPRPPDVEPNSDASTTSLDASTVRFGTFVTVEFASLDVPTTPLVWSSDVDIDTDTSSLCNMHNNRAVDDCVVAATDITLGGSATLRAHGSKPIVLLATSVFNLQGTIDVSSRHDAPSLGPGAAAASSCQGTPAMGHSGGFGGSFGRKGGDGGTPVSTVGESAGIASPAISFPAILRGGCPGGNGARDSSIGGAGGSGGGAVAIIAASLRIGGKINASGAGGRGGPVNFGSITGSGGGGGGSGGMIVIDTSSITSTGSEIWLFANGGGGGQGGTTSGIGTGPGDDGQESPSPGIQAPGGANTSRSGGIGGDGSAGTSPKSGDPPQPAVNSGGGGAGGGGSGFIRSPPIPGALFAPIPITP